MFKSSSAYNMNNPGWCLLNKRKNVHLIWIILGNDSKFGYVLQLLNMQRRVLVWESVLIRKS